MGEFICETDQEKWASYHLLDLKEFHNIALPKELGIHWTYLPRECLPNGEGVAYFKIKHIYVETITHEDIELFFYPNKCHSEEIRIDIKINGEGVVNFKINHIYAETVTREDLDEFLYRYKYHPEKIKRPNKIICETEKEEWEKYCLHPDKLRQFLVPCDFRGDWYYAPINYDNKMDKVAYFKVGEQLYAEITAHDDYYPFILKKWEWDENNQRMRACARYQLTNT
jgi:hypothetical protein